MKTRKTINTEKINELKKYRRINNKLAKQNPKKSYLHGFHSGVSAGITMALNVIEELKLCDNCGGFTFP
jgi:hypothetical protein